jgi:hypothetical protein
MLLYGPLSQERFNEIVDNKYKVYYGIVKDVFLNFFSNEEVLIGIDLNV